MVQRVGMGMRRRSLSAGNLADLATLDRSVYHHFYSYHSSFFCDALAVHAQKRRLSIPCCLLMPFCCDVCLCVDAVRSS